MSDLVFEKFPSIKRLNRRCIITEKIDGTNAQINFDADGNILCGSRVRAITPDSDNHGFARWAYANKEDLFRVLGEGRHFGEWWGSGIQRRYGMNKKIFSLFNTGRWNRNDFVSIDQLDIVPVLYDGNFTTEAVCEAMRNLSGQSAASLGFANPEGVVVFHTHANKMFKVTFEHDEKGKNYGH